MAILPILIVVALLTALVTGGVATTAVSIPAFGTGWTELHRQCAMVTGIGAVVLLAVVGFQQARVRKLVGLLIVGVAAQAFLQGGFLHAMLGQVLVAGSVALFVAISPAWTREPQFIQDYGWPSLRSLAFILPVLIGIQIALGAAFRHQILGWVPHIIGAMLVALFILMVGSFVLQQCKTHKTLLFWGRALMVVTFTQVFFGVAIFTVRLLPNPTTHMILGLAGAHVTIASLLLASSVVLGMHIRRNVTPKA